MLEPDDHTASEPTPLADESAAPAKKAAKKAAAKKAPAKKAAAKKAPAKKAPAKKAAPAQPDAPDEPEPAASPPTSETDPAPAKKPAKKAAKKAAKQSAGGESPDVASDPTGATPAMAAPGVLFLGPAADAPPATRRRPKKQSAPAPIPEPAPGDVDITAAEDVQDETAEPEDVREAAIEQATGARRRRRRGRRGRGGGGRPGEGGDESAEAEAPAPKPDNQATAKPDKQAAAKGGKGGKGGKGTAATKDAGAGTADDAADETAAAGDESGEGGTHRRRRRRRAGEEDGSGDEAPNTVTHVREPKAADDGVKAVKGSTRLEAKRQRRRDGRETTRRRAPILSEAEFLARREAVDRVMALRQNGDRTQIAVLEDGILVEHYVTRASATSYVGNVYLGRVQNVLPSMEAAFVDIGKGRNGVLYAGEVNWDTAGLAGKSRAIENAMKSGDAVLVQVTKDPIGHKGARLTSQVSLPGRYLVYVPGGGMTGISRRLPDTERHRLKGILKKIVPEDAGVIVRTAAEGATEEDLTRDVERLKAQWETIEKKAKDTKSAPMLVHGEPDLATRVVRDVFNEDFQSLVVQGDEAWQTVSEYISAIAPDLAARMSRHAKDSDLFHDLRVDEQLMKALDRKVWLPSGGSLVIDRTEAMTVIDVNTGKFVGAGGNLEQTVTRNNIEAAEEIVRQLRLRDVGGIVVIDFIDMVLESNRELVLRRLTECLGRDRTKHQVAEVTSLGLVQMTRKRVGEGLLEAFSEPCEVCHGRGLIIHSEPVDEPVRGGSAGEDERPAARSGKRKRGGARAAEPVEPPATEEQRRAASAAIAAIHRAAAEKEAGGEGEGDGEGRRDDPLAELAGDLVDAAAKETEGQAGTETTKPKANKSKANKSKASKPKAAKDKASQQPDASEQEVSEPKASETASFEPPKASEQEASEPTASEAAPTEPADAAEPAAAVDVADAEPAPRRRRRVASRPAGPPGAA